MNQLRTLRDFGLVFGLSLAMACPANGIIEGHDFDALDKSVSVDEKALTLDSGIALISKMIGLSITVDEVALSRSKIDRSHKFHIKLDGVTAAEAIAIILLRADPEKKLCVLNRKGKLVVGELDGNIRDMIISPNQLKP